MIIISSREFRENQKSYFDKIDAGEEILIQRGKTKSYKITPIQDNETLVNKETFFKMLDESKAQYERGEFVALKSNEDLEDFFRKIESEHAKI